MLGTVGCSNIVWVNSDVLTICIELPNNESERIIQKLYIKIGSLGMSACVDGIGDHFSASLCVMYIFHSLCVRLKKPTLFRSELVTHSMRFLSFFSVLIHHMRGNFKIMYTRFKLRRIVLDLPMSYLSPTLAVITRIMGNSNIITHSRTNIFSIPTPNCL